MNGLGETPDGLTAHGPESSVAAFCEQEHLEYRASVACKKVSGTGSLDICSPGPRKDKLPLGK